MTQYRSITVNFLDGATVSRSGTDASPVTISRHDNGDCTITSPEDILYVPTRAVKYIEARPVLGEDELAACAEEMRKESRTWKEVLKENNPGWAA